MQRHGYDRAEARPSGASPNEVSGARAVIRAAARGPFLPQRQEFRRGHWVDAADRHRPAPDGPVIRRQLSGALEMAHRAFDPAGLVQMPGEPELGARQLLVGIRQHLMLAYLVLIEGQDVLAYPGAHRVEIRGRVESGQILEHLAAEGDVVRPHDGAARVDPYRHRHVDDAVEVRDAVLGVDQARMRW